MIKNSEKLIILCRDRTCINNDYATDTCDIDEGITIVKGQCMDKVKSKEIT